MTTGDIRIDALLEQVHASLAMNHSQGTGAVITYSFLQAAPSALQVYDLRSLNEAQRVAIKTMLSEVSTQIGVTFEEVSTGGVLGYASYSGRVGLAQSTDNKAESITDGTGSTVWLNWQVSETQDLASGYGRQLVLHETAHALGLKHPQAYSSYESGPFLPAAQATAEHTIMAYNGGNTEHLGDYDLLALQYLWGPSGNPAPVANVLEVNASTTTGSYFNDILKLDVSAYGQSVRVAGLAGTDQLQINIASGQATFQNHLAQFTYAKADGSFAGVYLDSIERVKFTDKVIALDIDGNAGQAYRLYKAAFDRAPDKDGLGFWIGQLDRGAGLDSVAAGFVASQEFQTINGVSPSNVQLVTSLYQHILGRAPDQSGLDFWTAQLDSKALDNSHLLISFAESTENKIALTGLVENGIEYNA